MVDLGPYQTICMLIGGAALVIFGPLFIYVSGMGWDEEKERYGVNSPILLAVGLLELVAGILVLLSALTQ